MALQMAVQRTASVNMVYVILSMESVRVTSDILESIVTKVCVDRMRPHCITLTYLNALISTC